MKIPTSFKLYGQTIKVERVANLAFEKDARGDVKLRQNKIRLHVSQDWPATPEQIEQTFCHEFIHWLFFHASDNSEAMNRILDDDVFVDRLGHLLHQALSTMTYEPSKPS